MNQQITTVLDSFDFSKFLSKVFQFNLYLLMGHKWIKGQQKKAMNSNV